MAGFHSLHHGKYCWHPQDLKWWPAGAREVTASTAGGQEQSRVDRWSGPPKSPPEHSGGLCPIWSNG